ncbi:DnaB-like helicase N-terminal domain-containing protein [Actinacidiphila glaucinigra]|uniref:DnaB-like helicase N-terminal domain-containing protein n=1 Tax=Actinacidiphila glaucinigra TaxID=235986 RepID=UPI0033B8F442
MPKTLISTPDPDHPPPGPALSDEHAEHLVLAAVLRHSQVVPYLMAVLDPTHFSSPACREVFLAAAAIHHHKGPCTAAAVTAELARRQRTSTAAFLEQAKHLVTELGRAAVPAEPVVVHYAAIVRDLAAVRRQTTAHREGLPPVPTRGFLIGDDTT